MLKIIINLILIFSLFGCSNTKIVKIFPEPPKELLKTSPKLYLLNNDAKLSDITYIIVENYMLYHQETEKLKNLQEWIKQQQKLYK